MSPFTTSIDSTGSPVPIVDSPNRGPNRSFIVSGMSDEIAPLKVSARMRAFAGAPREADAQRTIEHAQPHHAAGRELGAANVDAAEAGVEADAAADADRFDGAALQVHLAGAAKILDVDAALGDANALHHGVRRRGD